MVRNCKICFLAQWVFALKFQFYGENVVQKVWNFDSQSPRRGNWERSWGREGRFPYTHISTPKVRNCEIVDCLNELLLWSFRFLGRTSPPPPYFESDWGLLYWIWGALSDWFLVNRRGFEPRGLNQRFYGQICFNWVRELACFLLDFGNKVADPISCSFLVIVGFWQLHLAIIG